MLIAGVGCSMEWLLECAAQRRRVQLKPHHYLNLTRETMDVVPDVCKYGDM